MIRSTLNPSVKYRETMEINQPDKGKEYDIYEFNLLGINVLITIGEPNNVENLIYFPLYLIKHDRKATQIGLYEIERKIISYNTINETNLMYYINLSTLILYSFANIRYIRQLYLSPERYLSQNEDTHIQTQEDNLKQTSNKVKREIFRSIPTTASVLLLDSEQLNDANSIHTNYTEKKGDHWICKFMKNSFYSNHKISHDGNTFFECVVEAFNIIGEYTTVQQLKHVLVDNLTDDVFNKYYTLYNEYKTEIKQLIMNKNDEIKKYNKLNQQKNTSSEILMHEITKEMKILKNKIDDVEINLNILKKNIKKIIFMRNVTNIDDLKHKIEYMSDYIVDDWAINTIEYALNIKTIILSKDEYIEKDFLNVLNVNDVNDEILTSNVFNPTHYIILEVYNDTYQLIKYKGKGILKFSELPYDLKILITDKCMSRQCGAFHYIRDFDALTNERNQRGGNKRKRKNNDDNQILDELHQYGNAKLWDDEEKIYFYGNSSDKYAGEIHGEQISKNRRKNYSELSKIKNWRKKLDDSWVQPFILDGKTWASVEHYFQASKFKNHPEIYDKFSLDNETELSKNVYKAKQFADKYIELMDETFNPKIELYTAQDAKFSQHDDLSYLLVCTNNANLFQQRKQQHPLQATNLMIIRKRILDQNI